MQKKCYRIDIHGLTENDAYCAVLEMLNSLPAGAKELTVVHGFHGGNVLKNMVREFTHYKIESIIAPFYNDGETIFLLKK